MLCSHHLAHEYAGPRLQLRSRPSQEVWANVCSKSVLFWNFPLLSPYYRVVLESVLEYQSSAVLKPDLG